MKRHLIEIIFEAMTTDTDGNEKQADRLERLYNEADQTKKKLIDEVMMCLCGWTMKTLIEEKDKGEQ